MPFLENALKAVDSITPKDINEFKTNKNPVDVIRLIVDGVLILMHQPVIPVKERTLKFRKGNLDFIDDSFD